MTLIRVEPINVVGKKLEQGNSYVSIYEGLSAKVVLYILDEGKYLYDGCFS
jgi:hypothetical protein